jgi:hypothetical protein
MRSRLAFIIALILPSVGGGVTPPESRPGLTAAPDGTVLKNGQPFRAIGINYFSCFLRTLDDKEDRSSGEGFKVLARYGIPFVRFCATGFWPKDMTLYRENPEEYFRRLDAVVRMAERNGIGLIPSLFFLHSCVPDLVGEPVGEWGNAASKSHVWMRKYVREVVTRYKNSPAVWAWEFGNEFSLQASLPNAENHRPAVHPDRGTPAVRTARDDVTFEIIRVAMAEFARAVREVDPHRLIVTGDGILRPSSWHQEHERTWTKDTREQFQEMVAKVTPDPVNGLSLHAYDDEHFTLFDWTVEAARKMNKPVFVGEFGAPGDTPKAAARFRRWLATIERSGVPLAALWVFDLPSQAADYSITEDNARAYQLKEISEANARIQKQALRPRP